MPRMSDMLRTIRNLIIAAFVIAIGFKVATGFLDTDCDTGLCCPDCDVLSVTRIVDGDTFVSDRGRVRLYGVDAPEVGERCAGDATERLKEMAGGTVRVESGPRERDRYGRLLYYVYSDGGESIDEQLVLDGLAWAWTSDGQHRDFLVGLEEKARDGGKGCLW
jgi:endonuclease YncB( thermonuclease family)